MSKDTQTTVCNELKTLKYKSMILNGIPWPENNSSSNLSNLDKFLEKDNENARTKRKSSVKEIFPISSK